MGSIIFVCLLMLFLSTPLLNLLVGGAIGVGLLFEMIGKRRYTRAISITLLSIPWVGGAFYWFPMIGNRYFLALACFLLLCGSTFAIFYITMRRSSAYQVQLDAANRLGRGTFSFDCSFGAFNNGYVVCLDASNKMLALIGEKDFKVEPFSHITGWNLSRAGAFYSEKGFRLVGGCLQLKTKNFMEPIWNIYVNDFAEGETWIERLNLMFSR